MQQEGIKGRLRDTCCCPLARYLRRVTGRTVSVTVRTCVVGTVRLPLPDTVERFRSEFDCGKYPELIEDVDKCFV